MANEVTASVVHPVVVFVEDALDVPVDGTGAVGVRGERPIALGAAKEEE